MQPFSPVEEILAAPPIISVPIVLHFITRMFLNVFITYIKY